MWRRERSRPDEYMEKLDRFITSRTQGVKELNNQGQLRACYDRVAPFYRKKAAMPKNIKSKKSGEM